MKRRQFVKLPLAASALALDAPSDSNHSARTEVFVNAGTDRDRQPFEFLDATFQVKVSGKDTEGRCVIFDTTVTGKSDPTYIYTQTVTSGFL